MGIENIGDNILKLRKNKGITQEVLAEFIGVTKTSVSKWETGATLPDIQILPLLASFFDVSIDTLMDYIPTLNQEQIRFHYHRLAEAFAHAPFSEVLAECKELTKKYYSCYPFLQQMIVLLLNYLDDADTDQDKQAAFQIAYDLCTRILAECQEVTICKNAVSFKAMLDLYQGKAGLVIEEAEKDALNVNLADDMELLLTMAYLISEKKEEAKKASQIGMYRNLIGLIRYGVYLLLSAEEDADYGISLLSHLDKVIKDFSLSKLNPNIAGGYEYQAAVYTAKRNEQIKKAEEISDIKQIKQMDETVFYRLERYIQACKQLFADGLNLHGDTLFNCLDQWFQNLELGTIAVRSEKSVRKTCVQSLKNPVFAQLQDQNRLQKLIKEISEIEEINDINKDK